MRTDIFSTNPANRAIARNVQRIIGKCVAAVLREQEKFSLKFGRFPFAKTDTLALRWGSWLMRVAYEEGSRIQDESVQIQEILGDRSPRDLSSIDRRVRVVFGDDDDREYTNQIIDMMQFL